MAKIDPFEVSLIYELIGLIHESWVDLEKAEEYIKKEFNINIVKLIEKDWQFLIESSKKRNFIIHHASYNDSGKKIEISNDDITKLISIVDKLVFEMELELFNRGVII